MAETIPLYQVDAFTARAFAGNPAAVCLPGGERAAAWMQLVAREMNLSETAFVWPEGGAWRLRWFTPAVEVELCGHATLASAHVLWETGLVSSGETARFETLGGRLLAARWGDGIELDFPSTPEEACAPPAGLVEALGVRTLYVGRSAYDLLVVVEDEATVRGLRPDMARLARVEARGVMVTSVASSAGYDFVSRFFGPVVGVDEDPVTGSAHCCLGPYWGRRLGKTELVACQVSARGGHLEVGLRGDRVALRGRAVTVLRGELTKEAARADPRQVQARGPGA